MISRSVPNQQGDRNQHPNEIWGDGDLASTHNTKDSYVDLWNSQSLPLSDWQPLTVEVGDNILDSLPSYYYPEWDCICYSTLDK